MIDDDMDFTKPQADRPSVPREVPEAAMKPALPPMRSNLYDAQVASKLFKAFGNPEFVKSGEGIFVENDKAVKGGLFKTATVIDVSVLGDSKFNAIRHSCESRNPVSFERKQPGPGSRWSEEHCNEFWKSQ